MARDGGEDHETDVRLPAEPIDRLTGPLQRFLHIEAASGVVLLICTVAALALANSAWSEAWLGFWKTKLAISIGGLEMRHSLQHWLNDGLMAVFFFVVGLEVKREIVLGELRELRKASLPIAGALGGMLVPAAIYLALQSGEPGERGWGIPMATDIAFVVGCMALLGSRVPHGLRVMLLSLAIIDDIGAILVIAIGYSSGIDGTALALGVVGILFIALLARIGVRSFGVYTLAGGGVWLAFHESGIHATIAGVILGLMTPTANRLSTGLFAAGAERLLDTLRGDAAVHTDRAVRVARLQRAARELVSPLEYLEARLHPWVGFVIMPVFALANAGVPIGLADFGDPVALAIAGGLLLGKPLGIVIFAFLAVRIGLARLPDRVHWDHVAGGGVLAGIGFTMALFIGSLALEGALLDAAKVGVLGASAIAMLAGVAVLAWRLPPAPQARSG